MYQNLLFFANIFMAIMFFAMTVSFLKTNQPIPSIVFSAILTIISIANVFYIGF